MNMHLENQHTLNTDIEKFIKERELKTKQIREIIEKCDIYKDACARAMLNHNTNSRLSPAPTELKRSVKAPDAPMLSGGKDSTFEF
jgi:hypothetical protein